MVPVAQKISNFFVPIFTRADSYLFHAMNKNRFHKFTKLDSIERVETLKAQVKIMYSNFLQHLMCCTLKNQLRSPIGTFICK